jgi:hypothetical protein
MVSGNTKRIEQFNELLEEVKKDRASAVGQRTDERYQMDWKDFNDTIESRRKRRKVMPDIKVCVANELEAEGNGNSECESDSE